MKNAEIILQEARVLFNAKQYKQSLGILKNQTILEPKFILQKYVLEAAIAVRTDQVDQALLLIEKAESIFGEVDESIVNIKAVAYRAKGELQKAKGILQGGVEKFSKSIDLAHNLSVTAADLGEFELAEKAGLKALEINPKYVETFKNLGRIYVTTRNTVKARDVFERLNAISANSVDVLVGLGAIELIDFNPKKAKTYFEKALQKDDSLSAAWANLGLCHKFLGNYQSAKKCLETAAKKDPKQVEHVWNLSIVNLALGNFKEGWDQYEIRYNPKRIATDAVKLPATQIPMLTRQVMEIPFSFFAMQNCSKKKVQKKLWQSSRWRWSILFALFPG
jgi:tetratricopeptide (TPR) repeat protein